MPRIASLILKYIFVLLMLSSSAVYAQGTWSRVATQGTPPSQRSAPVVAALGHHVYLFGGVNDDYSTSTNTFLNDLFRFDTRSNTWTKLNPQGPVPEPRSMAAAVALPWIHAIFVFGGANYAADLSTYSTFDDLWIYRPFNNAWIKLNARNQGPSGRSKPAIWAIGDVIYLFGGIDSSYQAMNDFWRFDIRNQRWTLLSANGAAGSPTPRFEAAAGMVNVNSKLEFLLYGGMNKDQSGYQMLNDTWSFHPGDAQAVNITPADGQNITPAHGADANAVLDNMLYLHGGDLPGGPTGCGALFPENVDNSLWRFDASAGQWQQLTPAGDALPRLKRHAAASVEGKIYFFSGYDFACADGVGGKTWNLDVFTYQP